jgi:osmotically-inducible protein OsmY
MSDLSLHDAIMTALADNPHVHPDEISVEVDGGDVTLRGTVGTLVQHAETARTTRRVPGVRRVDDRLRVHPAGLDGHGEADDDTQAVLLDAFLADDELHPFDIDVRVRDGSARLRGDVDSDEKREHAQRIALRVPGVVDVRNQLEVWPSALPMGSVQGEQR